MCCLQSGGTWTLLTRLILRSDIDKRQMLPNLFKHSPKFCSLFSCNKLWSSNKSQVTIFSLSETSENSENSQISRQAAVKELELVLIWNMEAQIQYSKIFCFLTFCSVYVVTINILFGHLFWFTTFYKVSKIQLVKAVTCFLNNQEDKTIIPLHHQH